MSLPEFCVKRPVFATVLSLIITAMGLVFFLKLPVRGMPNVDQPVIKIESQYFGADAAFIEQNVTNILEAAVKTAKNLDNITSSSSAGMSEIQLVFKLSADMEVSLNDVRSKVSDVIKLLPQDMDPPSVSKMDSDNWPSIWLSVTSNNHAPMELTDIVKQRIQPIFERLNNVGKAQVYSSYNYSIQINLDPTKLYSYKLSPIEVENLIKAQNKDYPSGTIKTSARDFVISLKGKINTPQEYENLIIKNTKGKIIKLKDVAQVNLAPAEATTILRYNGTETIALGLIKQAKANVIEMSDQVELQLKQIESSLPSGVKIFIAYDSAVPVKASIKSVYTTALEALVLVTIIIYLFLGNLKVILVPLVTIPVSMIGTFSFMYLAGFTINLYTLLAMILAIGLVVDDAIVMLENIYRHVEEGMSALDATFTALKEISSAIVAMTITLAAVFLPVGFIEGFVGKLFIEFAWTLAFCVLISGFVALTLSPVMSSRLISIDHHLTPPRIIVIVNDALNGLIANYIKKLTWALKHKKQLAIIGVSSVVILIASFTFVTKEFMPQEDDSIVLVNGTGPEGSNMKMLEKTVIEAEKVCGNLNEIKGYFFNIFGTQAFGFVPLKNWNQRSKSQGDIVNYLNQSFFRIPGMSLFAMNPGAMRGDFGAPVEISLQSFTDFKELDTTSQKFIEAMRNSGLFSNIERDLKTSTPTLDININRDYAALMNVSLDQVGLSLRYLLAGKQVGDFTIGNENYPITIRFAEQDRNTIEDLSKIYIKSTTGEMLNLRNLATINETISVQAYNHYNVAKSVKVSASLTEGITLNKAVDKLAEITNQIVDKNKINIDMLGDIKKMKETNQNMLFTFGLALIFIYLVLAAQFESYSDPLLILLAVPFSITGGVLMLILGGSSLNMYSNIGMITLIGLITKNSIMIVEFANQLTARGTEITEAIISACNLRIRPILMTTTATICGAIPLILAHGAGAESRRSIGLVIFGGMLIGTIFTLFIIPAIYHYFKKPKIT